MPEIWILSAGLSPWVGRVAFLLSFGILMIGLLMLPRGFIGQDREVPPWWRNVRVWAVVITIVQMCVYAYWG